MRTASIWFLAAAFLLSAYVWQYGLFYVDKPEPWPTVKGTIVSNNIKTENIDHKETFIVHVKYQYAVDEKTSVGEKIRPLEEQFKSRKQAEKAAKIYPPGKEVEVYVNPDKFTRPRALLEWVFPDTPGPAVFFIILLTVVGSVMLLYTQIQTWRQDI